MSEGEGQSPLFRYGAQEQSAQQYADDEFLDDDPDGYDDHATSLVFTSLESFVAEYLSNILHRRLNRATAVWCPSWWKHPEALVRLNAMWRAFEFLRLDPMLGMSTWWLHHADPHLRVLMDPEYGPFSVCDPREGHTDRPLGPLPYDPAPPGIFDDPAYTLQPEELPAQLAVDEEPVSKPEFDAGPWSAVGRPKDIGQHQGF